MCYKCIMDPVLYADNELVFLEGDGYTSAIVLSTGVPDKFKVEISQRAGIARKCEMNYDEVAQLVVDSVANKKRLVRNYLFKGGLKEAVYHCSKKYRESHEPIKPVKYEDIDTDFEKSLIAKDAPLGA
jgi:hypothetical protein